MQKVDKANFLAFIIGYLLFFYSTVGIALTIFHDSISESWIILGEYESRMKIILIICPLFALFFGLALASVSILSYTAMGADRLKPSKFFGIGWICFVISNAAVLPVSVQLFIDKEFGKPWVEAVGVVNFNALFYFVAPSVGFIGGVIFNIIIDSFIKAQRE